MSSGRAPGSERGSTATARAATTTIAADATSRLSPYLHFGCVSPGRLRRAPTNGEERMRCVRPAALLARLLRPAPRRASRDAGGRPAASRRPLARRPRRARGLEGGDDGLSARRRGHASAARRGLDAQPRTDGDGLVPRQGPRDRLARRCAPLLRPPCSTATWRRTSATGNGSRAPAPTRRPNRVYNPAAQLKRLDPDGAYVRRYVPELAGRAGRRPHRPRSPRTVVPASDRRPW